jgi:hypothetical protein
MDEDRWAMADHRRHVRSPGAGEGTSGVAASKKAKPRLEVGVSIETIA